MPRTILRNSALSSRARENGDVKALAESTGQSERTAHRQTAVAKKQTKADMKARAYQLYSENCDNDTIIATLEKEYGKKVTQTLQRVSGTEAPFLGERVVYRSI